MAKYYYSKYNTVKQTTYSLGWALLIASDSGFRRDTFSSYTFNPTTGAIAGSGTYYSSSKGGGDAGPFYIYEPYYSAFIRMDCKVGSTQYPVYKAVISPTTSDVRGSLVQSNIIAENGTYPVNGKHTDGYWYVRGSLANVTPTTPSSISVPELRGGETSVISWGASTDADGDTINYYLERSVNGGGYTIIRSGGTSTSYDDTIDKTWNTVTYRVRAYDGIAYSGYRTSGTVNVKHFPEFHMRVNGTLKTSDGGWVRVNGVLREIESITVKINGVLKEV